MGITDMGIPDDSPENTVKAIQLIVEEEAEALGQVVAEENEVTADGVKIILDLTHNLKWIRICLSCDRLLSSSLPGTGFISWGGPSGDDPGNVLHLRIYQSCAPYRWEICREAGTVPGRVARTGRYLDGIYLRQLVREKLAP